MKLLKQLRLTHFFALALIFTLFSCSSDEDPVSAPTVTLVNTSFTTPFFTEGTTEAPVVEWNGDVGVFSLGSTIAGVSIDANTGVVSWSKLLPLGTNTIEIIASNSGGKASNSITIENQLSGNFDGAYNNDPNSTDVTNDFDMNFYADGTINVLDVGTSKGIGTWTMSDNKITSVYSYNEGASYFTIVVDLIHSETDVELIGYWSSGETLADPAGGYIKMAID